MIVVYNTNYTHNSNSYLTRAVLDGASAAFAGEEVVLVDNEDLMRVAAGGPHRALICIDGQRLRADMLRRVRGCFAATALWLFEDPFMVEQNTRNAALFDLVFTNDPSCVASYGGKGRYLPLAAARDGLRPVLAEEDLDFDVFFAGTMWPNRTRVIERLISTYGSRRLKLICPTNEYLPPLPRRIVERSIDRGVSHSAFLDFANRSKLVLTIYRDFTSGGGVGKAGAPGPRYYETALAGVPQVIALDAGSATDLFDLIPGNSLCQNEEELFSAIDALLSDPSERRRRAVLSQDAVRVRHLYDHRLGQVAKAFPAAELAAEPAGKQRTRVVFCTHSVKTARHIGGIEIYQDLLGSLLGEAIELFYWTRGDDACALLDRDLKPLETFSAPAIGWLDVLSDPHEEALFSGTLTTYGIDVVHFHHLGHHAASLPIIAKALGLGVIFSVHDYFLVCSRYNLLGFQHRYCDITSRPLLACDTCLGISEELPAGAQQTRRAFMSGVVDSVDIFLFGTSSSLELLVKIYPRIARERCEVLGILNAAAGAAALERPEPSKVSGSPVFNVAILGNVLRPKGADCLLRVLDLLVGAEGFVFHVFGKADKHYAEKLAEYDGTAVRFRNGYSNTDVSSLTSCDVALFLSLWPETFSISLSEAWQAGMIPIASDIGAFADRIEDGITGFLVPVDDEAVVATLLQRLKANPDICRDMRRSLSPALWPERETHVGRLRALYARLAPKGALGTSPVKIDIGQIGLLPHFSWKTNAPPRHILEEEQSDDISLSTELLGAETVFGDAAYVVESIGGLAIGERDPAVAAEPTPVNIGGWAFALNEVLSGQVQVALVGLKQSIFMNATRLSRLDVCERHPAAPEQSGFAAAASFLGRWSDGDYHLVLLNRVASKTYVVPTPHGIRLSDGAIEMVVSLPLDKAQLAFIEVRLRGGSAPSAALGNPLSLTCADGDAVSVVEDISRAANGGTQWVVRGWYFHPGMNAAASRLFVGFASGDGPVTLRQATRLERADVKSALGIEVLKTGFREEIELPAATRTITLHVGWSDQASSSRAIFEVAFEQGTAPQIARRQNAI